MGYSAINAMAEGLCKAAHASTAVAREHGGLHLATPCYAKAAAAVGEPRCNVVSAAAQANSRFHVNTPMNLFRFLLCVCLLGWATPLQASPAGDTAKAVGRLLRDVENIEGPTLARGAALSSKTYNRMNEEQKSSGIGTFILLLLFGFFGLAVVKVVLLLSRPKTRPTSVKRAAPAATAPRPPVAYSSIARSAPPSIPPPIPQPAHTPPPLPRSTHTPPPLPTAQY